MKLSVKALAFSSAVVWGGSVLACGLLNLRHGSYAGRFLDVMSSLYPGFHNLRTSQDVMVGTGCALLDGAMAGAMAAALYNLAAGSDCECRCSCTQTHEKA